MFCLRKFVACLYFSFNSDALCFAPARYVEATCALSVSAYYYNTYLLDYNYDSIIVATLKLTR
jgi:hypothetical protein